MPVFLESRLKKAAAKKGFSGDKADHYVYGALNNQGVMKGSKETAKGKKMQKKHDAKTGGQDKMRKLSELA